jgi:hypothetical protein
LRKRRAAERLQKGSGIGRKSSRITSLLADRYPYRGSPKGRVKWVFAPFGRSPPPRERADLNVQRMG